MSDEYENGQRGRRSKNNMRRRQGMMRWLIRIMIVVLVVAFLRGISGVIQYESFSVVSEAADISTASADYKEFGNDILKVTLEGITCFDTSGQAVWNGGYSMTNPQCVIQGSYGAVADIQSTSAVIFNDTGVLGTVKTTLPILNATVSDYGVLALVLDDTDADYITFYDNTAAELDIKIKTKLSGDGFPLDICLSPTGTGLIASVVYLENGSMQNRVVFYNFDVGQSNSNNIVGYYSYEESMFPEVAYLSDHVAVSFGEDQINLYSMRNELKPDLIKNIPIENQIYSVFYDDEQVGVICENDETAGRILTVYDTDGDVKYQAEIDFEYDHAEFSDGCAVIYGSSNCLILNGRGHVRYQGTLDTQIRKLIVTGNNSCIVMGSTSMEKIRFR